MKTRTLSRYGLLLSGTALVVATAAAISRRVPANQTLPHSAGAIDESQVPVEFARRGLSLLKEDGGLDPDATGDSLKADALIMRAWNLQQAYPESCLPVWQLTQTLVDQQKQPNQKLALAILYLNSVDATIESAMTPEGFEASWAVRQAVRSDIERYRQDAFAGIESDIQKGLDALSGPHGIRVFADGDAARWSSLSAELSALTEPLPNPPEPVTDLARKLGDRLATILKEKLADLETRLKEEAVASSETEDPSADGKPPASRTPLRASDNGPITRLLEELHELVRLRDSASVTSWIDLAASLGTRAGSTDSQEATDEQLLAMEVLRSKMLETRALRYNIWAADAVYNADRRGADGLFLLGAIETRLLVSTVAASYSITEGKILGEIPNPFNRQVKIREVLGQTKKQLAEF